MLKRNNLLEELISLRQQIRFESMTINNEEVIVCTDLALLDITKKMPLQKSDFLAISGLDNDFVENYAIKFLKVINQERLKETKEVKVSKKAYKVLNNYKDRLTNISKSNDNLYLGKIHKIKSFDLSTLFDSDSFTKFLTNSKTNEILLKVEDKDNLDNHLTILYRSINKEFRENGLYNLYIAYPYVENYIKREKFAIKAPLLYFPVKIERRRKKFYLLKDSDKDILFNRDLLLTSAKFNKANLKEDIPIINDFNLSVLNNIVIPYYRDNGILIKDTIKLIDFNLFKDQLKDEFTKTKYSEYELKQYLVLGRYQVHSSMIQKDINAILQSNKYNELLDGLVNEDSVYNEEKDLVYEPKNKKINEFDINYINDLNDAQEHVIELLNKEKKLVVWGPPGTGKSQTITSLIANSVLKGENVLVISEKKVALDVIYSRLTSASKYVMFIDDAENKVSFYNKLNNLIDLTPPIRTINNDVYKNENEITSLVKKLDKSIELLYQKLDGKTSVNNLFNRYLKDRDIKEELLPKRIYKMFLKSFNKLNYKEVKSLENTFSKDLDLKEYLEYYENLLKYPLLGKLETRVTRSSKIEFEQFNIRFESFHQSISKTNFFKRRKLIKVFINNEITKIDFLSNRNKTLIKYLKLLIKDNSLHQYFLVNINKLNKIKTKFEKLSNNDLKYLSMYLNESLLKDIPEAYKLRTYLFDAFYTGYLELFKTNNQKDLYVTNDYEMTKDKINTLIDEKRLISKESFEMELYKKALNFSNSRRIMDVKRTLESTNKPSIRSFINTFQPEMFENIKVWMMTPEVVSTIIPLQYGMFDLVIFDEASQMYVEKGIPAIYRAKKVVIAGDPKQLRPSSLGIGRLEQDDEFYEDDILKDVTIDARSLLDLARYKYHETILNYHYRSKYEELIAFSNHAFYNNKLIVSPNQVISKDKPIEYVYVENAKFVNRSNEEEAKKVIEIIKKIFRSRKNNETIGVITFNSAQRDLIENYIDQEIFKRSTYQKSFEDELFRRDNDEDKSLFVKNIENVQGDERDIIIFSMGYAKDTKGILMRRFGWLNHEGGQNRLNVAITRAREKIYFVSSLYPEEFKVDDLTSYGPKLLKDFMRYCYFISNGNDDMAKVVLNELHENEHKTKQSLTNALVNDVKKRLERFDYKIDTSIGIGNYQINLAVFDKFSNSYKLGIICDDENNVDEFNSRKDLIHQDRYLKARGWNVYRVFSKNWYTNVNKEIKNIRDLLK